MTSAAQFLATMDRLRPGVEEIGPRHPNAPTPKEEMSEQLFPLAMSLDRLLRIRRHEFLVIDKVNPHGNCDAAQVLEALQREACIEPYRKGEWWWQDQATGWWEREIPEKVARLSSVSHCLTLLEKTMSTGCSGFGWRM